MDISVFNLFGFGELHSEPSVPRKSEKPELGDSMVEDDDAPGKKLSPTQKGWPEEDSEDSPGLKNARKPDPNVANYPNGKKPERGGKQPHLPVEMGGDGGEPLLPEEAKKSPDKVSA